MRKNVSPFVRFRDDKIRELCSAVLAVAGINDAVFVDHGKCNPYHAGMAARTAFARLARDHGYTFEDIAYAMGRTAHTAALDRIKAMAGPETKTTRRAVEILNEARALLARKEAV